MTGLIQQDFSNASAGGSIVAGDQINNFQTDHVLNGSIKLLVQKLQKEMDNHSTTSGWIEDLVFFEENHPDDDVVGLEAKLDAAGMIAKRSIALKQKEHFAKFLEKRLLYDAAQQLLALCLHRIFEDFEAYVHPQCGSISSDDLNALIHEKIVCPLVNEYCYGAFSVNHSLVRGMTYWLADRCYVRWHKAA